LFDGCEQRNFCQHLSLSCVSRRRAHDQLTTGLKHHDVYQVASDGKPQETVVARPTIGSFAAAAQ